MKRIYQALWSALIAILIFACDDSNVNIVDNDIDNQFSRILFTPDSLSFPNDTTIAQVTFYGIDFSKIMPDSIIIDNSNVSFERLEDKKIIASLKGISRGTHSIDFFHKSSKVTLDKKLIITYDESAPPSAKSIYFTPDTLYIDMINYQNTINLYGVSFYKYKIDSAFIGSEKCQLGSKGVSILPIHTTITKTGNYPVIIYYKGNKIELQKKLTIINSIIDFDVQFFDTIIYSVQNIPILYKYSNFPERQIMFNQNYELNQFTRNLNRDVFKINYSKGITSFDMSIEFDNQYRIIKKLTSGSYNRTSYNPPYVEHQNRLTLYNLPFKINRYDNNKIELAIDLIGSIINDYFPLTVYEYAWWGGSQKNNDRSYGFTTTKVEPTTGRDINYYPATESSSIRIYLRNY